MILLDHDAITRNVPMSVWYAGGDRESLLAEESPQPIKALLDSQTCAFPWNLVIAQTQVDVPLRHIAVHGEASDRNSLGGIGGRFGGGGAWELRRGPLVTGEGTLPDIGWLRVEHEPQKSEDNNKRSQNWQGAGEFLGTSPQAFTLSPRIDRNPQPQGGGDYGVNVLDEKRAHASSRTSRISDPAPLTSGMQPRRNRGVRCIRFVRPCPQESHLC